MKILDAKRRRGGGTTQTAMLVVATCHQSHSLLLLSTFHVYSSHSGQQVRLACVSAARAVWIGPAGKFVTLFSQVPDFTSFWSSARQ